MTDFSDMLKNFATGEPTPTAPPTPSPIVGPPLAAFHEPITDLAAVRVEAVVNSCLMELTFTGTINPAGIPDQLRRIDPSVRFREDWPRKTFGPKETKSARIVAINARITDSGAFIDLICDGDISVSVSKKLAPGFPNDLAAAGASTAIVDKLRAAYEAKSHATIILAEAITAHYWQTDDGKTFLERLEKTPES